MSNRRRTSRRVPKSCTEVSCRKGALGLGKNILLETIDLSQEGACLRLKDKLKRGDAVELEISGLGQTHPLKVVADVVRVLEEEADSCVIGLRFEKALPYAAHQQLTRLVELV